MSRNSKPRRPWREQAPAFTACVQTDNHGYRCRKTVLSAALVVGLSLASSGVMAWGAKAYYPSSVSPALPGPEQAQRIAVAPPGFFGMLRDAHQASLDRGWKGVGAAFDDVEAPLGDGSHHP